MHTYYKNAIKLNLNFYIILYFYENVTVSAWFYKSQVTPKVSKLQRKSFNHTLPKEDK